jgi:outer membrane protein TolC/outer membrane protein OmpA-like peptidoglycan-associated protein
MIKKIILVFFLLSAFLNGNPIQDEIIQKIEGEFKQDFVVWDVNFDKEKFVIRFENSNMLYKKGSSDISTSFEIILKDFIPRYIGLISPYEKSIEKIIISGHTSSENSMGKTNQEKYDRNLILSQERADKVLGYINSLNEYLTIDNKNFMKQKFESVGKSSSELIYFENGEEDKLKSRRIEIAIKLLVPTHIVDTNNTNTPSKNTDTNTTEDIDFNASKSVVVGKTLNDYVQRLLKENQTIEQQNELINSLKQEIEVANAAFRPKVSLNGSYKNYFDYSDGIPLEKTNEFSRDISVQYNLFNGYKDKQEVEIAKSNLLTNQYTYEQIEDELIYSLAEAFITTQKVKDIYQLSRENYTYYLDWNERMNLKFESGLTTLRDFRKIEARTISRFMNFEEDTKRYNDTVSTMQSLLDFDDTEMKLFKTENPTSKYFNNVVLALNDVQLFSPYVKEAKNNAEMYWLKVEKAKVNHYPTVNLIGKKSILDERYTTSSGNKTTDDTSLTLELKFDLYSGEKDEADYQKKLHEYRQKVAQLNEVVRDVHYKLDLSFNKYYLLSTKNDFAKEAVQKREDEYVAANYDYKFAKLDANGLLDVTDSLYNAKREAIEAYYDFILVKYEILKNLGLIKEYFEGQI